MYNTADIEQRQWETGFMANPVPCRLCGRIIEMNETDTCEGGCPDDPDTEADLS